MYEPIILQLRLYPPTPLLKHGKIRSKLRVPYGASMRWIKVSRSQTTWEEK